MPWTECSFVKALCVCAVAQLEQSSSQLCLIPHFLFAQSLKINQRWEFRVSSVLSQACVPLCMGEWPYRQPWTHQYFQKPLCISSPSSSFEIFCEPLVSYSGNATSSRCNVKWRALIISTNVPWMEFFSKMRYRSDLKKKKHKKRKMEVFSQLLEKLNSDNSLEMGLSETSKDV